MQWLSFVPRGNDFTKALFFKVLRLFVLAFSFAGIFNLSSAYCAEVTLAWDANAEPYLAGYKIYFGVSSRIYSTTIDVGNALQYTIADLQPGIIYYFAATAYDSYGNESDFSAEVTYAVPQKSAAPVANTAAYSTPEDVRIAGSLKGTGPPGSVLTYSLSELPSFGEVVLVNALTGEFHYTPKADFSGTDSFSFRVSDGTVFSDPSTVSIVINEVNDAPTAAADQAQVDEEGSVLIAVLSNDADVDGDGLQITGVTQGENGAVSVSGDFLRYSPEADFNGTDQFSYTIADGRGGFASTQVCVTINPVNDAPKAFAGSFTTSRNTSLQGKLKAEDADGDALTYRIVDSAANGSLALDPMTGDYVYEPISDFMGEDSFSFSVNDGQADSEPAVIHVSVAPASTIFFEAESGMLAPPMKKLSDSSASGGMAIFVPKGSRDSNDPHLEKGYAEYQLDIPDEGEYFLYARVMTPKVLRNEFFVSMDGGDFIHWDAAIGGKDLWFWDQVRESETAIPVSFHLDAGRHTLVIKHCEAGAKIDRMALSCELPFFDESVYEDAEDLLTSGWEGDYDLNAEFSSAQVLNIFDEKRQSNVISLQGSKKRSERRLRKDDLALWENASQFVISWSMSSSRFFVISVELQTTAGRRYLSYKPVARNGWGRGEYIDIGLGWRLRNGRWNAIVRDLEADLERAQPGTKITSVDGLLVRGSLRIDDVKLRSKGP